MNYRDTAPNTHNHPLHLTKRAKTIIGASALGFLIAGGAGLNVHAKPETAPHPTMTAEQIFDSQVAKAIEQGPNEHSKILGTFAVGQDRTIGNAIIQEANHANRPTDIATRTDLLTVTLSANAFDEAHKPSYNPKDEFVLFEQDVNGDGTDEILASPVIHNK